MRHNLSVLKHQKGWLNLSMAIYEARTLQSLAVSGVRHASVSVSDRHDTRTTFYIWDITGVHVSVSVSCPVSVSVLVLHRWQYWLRLCLRSICSLLLLLMNTNYVPGAAEDFFDKSLAKQYCDGILPFMRYWSRHPSTPNWCLVL